jgi:hypothetical protein
MKILFTGKGTSGSYRIRAEQMAAALGAREKPMTTVEDCRAADVIVVVKRVPEQLLQAIRKSGRPWIYDIVDAYPQPKCTGWSSDTAKAWLKEHLKGLRPDFVIWPNERMQEDAGGRGAVVYHHHRPMINVNPIRDRIEMIGYEGAPAYLDGWHQAIESECRARGARFVVNPERLADVDVVLALRGRAFNGYVQQHWKSNVKLANAHGSGTPFIGAPECGYIETACGAEYWATTPRDLSVALDWLESKSARQEVSARFLKNAFSVDHAAERYRDILCALKF